MPPARGSPTASSPLLLLLVLLVTPSLHGVPTSSSWNSTPGGPVPTGLLPPTSPWGGRQGRTEARDLRKIGVSDGLTMLLKGDEDVAAPSTHKDTPSPSSTPTLRGGVTPAPAPYRPPSAHTPLPNVAPVPTLPSNYELVLSVRDVLDRENFEVRERERDGRAHHQLQGRLLNLSCIFDTLTDEGYTVEGVKCGRKTLLPGKCFCSDHFCRPYVPVTAILKYLAQNNATGVKEVFSGVSVLVWRLTRPNMTVEAVYGAALPLSAYDAEVDPHLAPLYFSVRGEGRVFHVAGGSIYLQYRVVAAPQQTASVTDLMATPPGVFCPAHERKYLPKLANQFTLTMETIIENLGTIAYEHQSYESEEKLVSYTYRPHLHAESMFFVHNIPGMTDLAAVETYRVVHDFGTGIQYMINEKTTNCSIQGIPVSALDAAPTDNQNIRLRHASELISLDPNLFIYKGTRYIRGVLCDVWVADRGTRKGQYSTVEIYFTHESWTVEIEVLNKKQQVPIGLSSYVSESNNAKEWSSKVHTFFYEYSDGHPSWSDFDISPCLNRINRLFLILTLEVSYSELVHYNLEIAKNSIRSAIAGIAGVSPLRITDLFLSSRHSTGEVDVWFVLMEKPDVVGPVLKPRPQLMMADAYKLLHDVTHKHNLSVKLDLSPKKKLIVTIKCGSLETTSGALHPNLRHKSLRFIQAGYTAGSMAGLGFSMVILGTCIGIFIGFLLWKHSSSVPYQVTD